MNENNAHPVNLSLWTSEISSKFGAKLDFFFDIRKYFYQNAQYF